MRIFHFSLFFYLIYFCLYAKQLEVDVFAKNVVLMNADNGIVLYEKKAKEKAYPASITKIATGLYVLDKKKEYIEEWVKTSDEAIRTIDPKEKIEKNYIYPAYWLETDGSSFELKKGEIITIRSLLYALMLVSGNDCANVIAENVSKTVPLFMKELNLYLKEIGCNDTNFCNPHGLHHPEHITTAYDMALMTKKALNIPQFSQIVSTVSYTTSKSNKQDKREITQYNRLLREGKHYYPFAIGVKTGYHSKANYNLVAAAEYENRKLIAVLMGGEKSDYRYIDAKKLFDAAFSEKKEMLTIFGKEKTFLMQVEGASNNLIAYLKDDFIYEYFPSEEQEFKIFIKWDDLKLPIEKDVKVGNIYLATEDGFKIKEVQLYTKDKVRRKITFILKQYLDKIF